LPLDIPFDRQALYDSSEEFFHAPLAHMEHITSAYWLLQVCDYPYDDCMNDMMSHNSSIDLFRHATLGAHDQ
jgi:hypothetical protein